MVYPESFGFDYNEQRKDFHRYDSGTPPGVADELWLYRGRRYQRVTAPTIA